MPKNIGLIFPGQGSQVVGMGADLYEKYDAARELYDRADEVLGFPISKLCFEGPAEELNDTANTQPAVYLTTLALWKVLAPRLGDAVEQVAAAAGHSSGQYSALAVVGVLDFEDGLKLVRRRGEAMRRAGELSPGAMAAIIGLTDEEVAGIVADTNTDGERVWMANYNSPGQVVIAGEKEALGRAVELAKERNAKRALPLAVSVACHTPLMEAASQQLAGALEATTFHQPWAPVVSNAWALPLTDPQEIKASLLQQLASPVRWVESIEKMVAQGVTTMVEVGPKALMSGLVRRIHRPTQLQNVTNVADIEAFEASSLSA